MKKFIVLIGLVMCVGVSGKQYIDTLYVSSGTDTIYTLDVGKWGFSGKGYIEFVYDSLSADNSTLDVGPSGFVSGDAITAVGTTFNSYGTVLGVSLPYTLDVTTNADSNTGVASIFIQTGDFIGNVIRIKITKGSSTAGNKIYIKYRR